MSKNRWLEKETDNMECNSTLRKDEIMKCDATSGEYPNDWS